MRSIGALAWVLWLSTRFAWQPTSSTSTVLNFAAVHSKVTFAERNARTATPQASVNAELGELEQQNGLTIAIFDYKGIGVLSFRRRSFIFRKLLFDGNSTNGAVSRDGTEIALTQPLSKPQSVVVVHPDGTDLREYPGIPATSQMCWSYDNSSLVLATPHSQIKLLDLKSKLVRDLGRGKLLTSQCWSPDGNQIVYEYPHENVTIYDIAKRSSTQLAAGTGPTWSPDGNWIAYRDGDTYYAIRPSGRDRKKLFTKARAVSALYWSPDSLFVAYVHQDRFALDTEFYHLMVRRLEDSSETAVTDGEDAGAGYNYQWVVNKELIARIESVAHAK